MAQNHLQRRALRARPRVDEVGRRLQGNDKKKNEIEDSTPPPTFAPTVSPTKKATMEDIHQGYVSLEWSLLLLPKDRSQSFSTTQITDASGLSGVDGLKNWISRDFLCFQENIWLTSDLNTLDSDCQSTIRRAEEDEAQRESQQLYPDRTIVVNDPVVLESQETLSDALNTEYTVWNIQYPVYSYADRFNEKEKFEERLQKLLNKQIHEEHLVWEDGVLAVVGNEMKVFAYNHHYWKTDDNYTLVEFGPLNITPLQALGAMLVLSQTIALIIIHIFINPYLRERAREKKLEKNESLVNYPPKQQSFSGSSHQAQNNIHSQRSQSSRTKNYTKRDLIPKNISIIDGVHKDSESSSAYPIPY